MKIVVWRQSNNPGSIREIGYSKTRSTTDFVAMQVGIFLRNPFKMRVLQLMLVGLLIMFAGCGENEPALVCDTNTITTTHTGAQSCGISRIDGGISKSGTQETIRMQVAGGYEVMLRNPTPFEEGKTYSVFSLTSTNLNRHISNSVDFVKIDRTAKKVTFKFRFENEFLVGSNGTAIFIHDGQATDLIY